MAEQEDSLGDVPQQPLPVDEETVYDEAETEESIKVAVRIRPLNAREKKKESKIIVKVSGNSLWLNDPIKNADKKFDFDFVYQSYEATNCATNEDIFKDLGHMFVDNAFDGYNASVFAYGQTGSGKTFTMLGHPKSPGLIPYGCEEIFKRIERNYRNSNIAVEVEASYLEIYMDRIFDLLAAPDPSKKTIKKGIERKKLPIRFHPKRGAFVEGLTMHSVGSYDDVRKLMNLGVANRTVAETQMNKISSRSHCIFTLHLQMLERSSGDLTRRKINLIDLAGSERVNKTGVAAGGERMEELKKINLSLNALGDVISALASRAKFVPFNNSTLTTLLRESLSGNSKTIMMAAISPAEDNFEESMSTLRYASRVKKIKTHARKNLAESKQSIERELRAEIDRLKKKLELQKGNQGQVEQITSQVEATSESLRRIQMEHSQKINEMNKAYASISKTLLKMGITVGESEEKQRRAPKLINISSDPSLSGSMVFFLVKSLVSVGCSPQGSNFEHEKKLEERAQKELERQIALNKGDRADDKETEEEKNKRKKDPFIDGIPDILLATSDPGVYPKHAILTVRRSIVDIRQVAIDERAKVWKLLFEDCDANSDGFLSHSEFNKWLQQIVATDKGFSGISESDYVNFCKRLKCDAKHGLDFNKLKEYYVPDILYDGIVVRGIAKSLLTKKLTTDVKEFLKDNIPIQTVDLDKNGIRIVSSRKITMKEITKYEKFILDMFEDTGKGMEALLIGPPDDETDNFIEETRITIESADPKNERLMIFVNGDRVRFEPVHISNGDNVLFGSRQLFQLIVPMQANDEIEKKKRRKKAESDMKDMVEKEQVYLFKKPVDSLVVFDKLLEIRLKQKCYGVENLDVEKLKAQVMFHRQTNSQQNDEDEWGGMRIHDQFMQDYRTLSTKTQTANSMSLELDRGLLFNVATAKYFDSLKDTIAERIIIIRECHYTEPELQLEMIPYQFEEMLTLLERYYELAKQDGETIATETMDDDPFVPGEVDACYGVTRLSINSGKLPSEPITLPLLLPGTNDEVGKFIIEPSLTSLDTGNKCYELQQIENKKVKLKLENIKVILQQPVKYCYISFVAIGADMVRFKCEAPTEGVKGKEFKFTDAYEPRSFAMSKNFRNFLNVEGIQFKVWIPVFDNPYDMPPVIASKYNSKNITIRIQTPDGEQLKLNCKTGNTITALKRKIDFQTNIPDDAQTLIYDKITLENNRTLSDYGIQENTLLLLLVETKRRKSVDAEFHPDYKNQKGVLSEETKFESMDELDDDEDEDASPEQVQKALEKELTNPDLTAEDRSKLRRAKNRSVHMVLMEQDSRRVLPMTMEGYQAENKKLKDSLRKAQETIETLQNEVKALEAKLQHAGVPTATATAKSSDSTHEKPKSGGTKFFGAWRRRGK